jgi:hypothetical protein
MNVNADHAAEAGDMPAGGDPRKLRAIYLLLACHTQADAAEAVGVDPKTVGRWLQEPDMKHEFAVQLTALSAEMWARLLAQIDAVLAVFLKLLNSDDPRVALRAATWYLDKVLGLLQLSSVLESGPSVPLPPALIEALEAASPGARSDS